ncbi:MAG: beta-ketoacyl synthase N-terminal-like domain-containing protein, partial [Alphaproteobacteria bacterium]
MSSRDTIVTGIGLISAAGEGIAANLACLGGQRDGFPQADVETFAPYPVFPMVPLDLSQQIPRRGDQRQMGPWQHFGVFAAGLALADAGLSEDAERLDGTNLIVAAGGGERDPDADTLIMQALRGSNDPGSAINEALLTELRPTLFLAQLSNLLAGNISIVHHVTGSSRTLMGEELA